MSNIEDNTWPAYHQNLSPILGLMTLLSLDWSETSGAPVGAIVSEPSSSSANPLSTKDLIA
jgi:hypothetical protein